MKNIFVFDNSVNGFASNVTDSIKRFFVKSCMCIINDLFVPINNVLLNIYISECSIVDQGPHGLATRCLGIGTYSRT